MKIHHINGSVLFESEHETIRETMVAANLQDANLQNANLQNANLQNANLQDVNLQGANLQGANLQNANLQNANLQDANLQDANLQNANLQDANLQDANLQNANLQNANLQDANLQDANLQDANLQDVNLQGANLQDVKGIPVADPSLPAKVAAAILANPEQLDMSSWHGINECGTTHCLAGWAVALTQGGDMLECLLGTRTAGQLLLPSAAYLFHASKEDALAWAKSVVAEKEESK